MTIDELIEALTDLKEAVGGHAEVVIGDQPHYPFECSISHICLDHTLNADEGAVVLCEGGQKGYGKRAWWHERVITRQQEEDEQ